MGLLVNGEWHDQWYDTKASDGAFQREDAQLRNWVTTNGEPGPTGKGGFAAESGRYHLYVSLACPWAHRTLIFRKLKQLEAHIDVSVVSPDMLSNGWEFDTEHEQQRFRSSGDALFNSDYMHQVYTRNKADYSCRVTVPVLWDKQQNCIVSNESSEIIRMFNSAFNELTVSALLWSSGTETLGVLIFNLDDSGETVMASALAMTIVMVVMALMGVIQLSARHLPKGVVPWQT